MKYLITSLALVIGYASHAQDLNINGNLQLNGSRSTIFTEGDLLSTHRGGMQFLTFDNGTTFIVQPTNQSGTTVNSTIRIGGFGSFSSNTVNLAVTGSVGIGTAYPGAALDVATNIQNGALGTVFGRLPEGNSSGAGTFLGVRGYDTQPVNAKSFAIEHSFYGSVNSSINFIRGGGITGGFLTFNTNDNSEKVRIDANGSVGIGTNSTGSYKLAVAGSIGAWGEVRVFTTGQAFPDYVFDPSYKLPVLEETEKYVKENHHLPEVPSAKEMEKNGIGLTEMNILLLKKVEELTLYMIEMKKKTESLEKQVEELKGNQKKE